MQTALWWLFLNFLTIVVLAFYSMIEMACVSLNKVRLHYYVSQGNVRALYLNYLLQNPARLFGTTLIGVNIAMVVGSECSREFFSAIGLSPDWAPLPQILLVVIFGELAPMFAARHYSENVAILGAPILYASAKLMAPLLWGINWISKIVNKTLYQHNSEPDIFLSQEELQKILEEHSEEYSQDFDSAEFNTIAANIFHLRVKNAAQIMTRLPSVPMIPSNGTVIQMRGILKKTGADFLLVYHNNQTNVVGIAFPRDLVRIPNTKRVRDYARPPWFVTENTKAMQILKQFRRNNQTVAVILNDQGAAVGVLNLDDLLEEIIGKVEEGDTKQKTKPLRMIERTLPGEMTVSEFNTQFDADLNEEEDLTLAEFIAKTLGHTPEVGDSIYIAPFEFEIKEASLLEAKTIIVTSRPT